MLDKSYLKDITLYGQKSYRTKEAIGTNMKFVKANPEDAEGFAYLSLNLSGVFEPVGAHLAEKIRAEGKVSTEEDKILKEATTYKDSELFKPYNEAAKIAADAYYIAYKTQDPGEALALLKKNAEVLKAQMKPLGTDDRDKYVSDSIKKSVDRIVADIWIYKYKGKAKNEAGEKLSSDAYEVYKLLGL
jgi:hypothetical protein